MYVVKVFATGGGVYRGPVPYSSEAEARADYNAQQLFGRFYRAELWSGSFANDVWADGEMLASKVKQ